MTHGSLFSGIGGFDLAAEWMGWDNLFHCEWNPFGQRVLKYYWPNAESYGDIKKSDFTKWRGKLDVLSGGDPCQGNSVIGLGGGEDSIYFMWPDFIRAAEEAQPAVLVNENFRGQISNGVIERKITDIQNIGYEVWPPIIIPANFTSCFSQRERVFIVANSTTGRLERRDHIRTVRQWQDAGRSISALVEDMDGMLIPKSGIQWGTYGIPSGLDGITVSKHRKESLMAYGNAVVPQVVYEIFKAIEYYELRF